MQAEMPIHAFIVTKSAIQDLKSIFSIKFKNNVQNKWCNKQNFMTKMKLQAPEQTQIASTKKGQN